MIRQHKRLVKTITSDMANCLHHAPLDYDYDCLAAQGAAPQARIHCPGQAMDLYVST